MHIRELRNLKRKDLPLAYRRTFTADAVFEGKNSGQRTQAVEFDLEQDARGSTSISVRLVGEAQYPIIPLMRELRAYISSLNAEGKLN